MAWRVKQSEVREALPDGFPASIDLQPFIIAGNALADKVSANDTNSLLNATLLKEIERYLAAHFAVNAKDERYADEEKQLDASAKYPTHDPYEDAMMLDVTGYLRAIKKGRIHPQVFWLGKAPSDQTLYRDRD